MSYLPQMYKALMPLVLAAVMAVLANVGIRGDMTVEEAVGYVLAAILVYLKRNEKK